MKFVAFAGGANLAFFISAWGHHELDWLDWVSLAVGIFALGSLIREEIA